MKGKLGSIKIWVDLREGVRYIVACAVELQKKREKGKKEKKSGGGEPFFMS